LLALSAIAALLACAGTAHAVSRPLPKSTIQARETFFGPKNVDRRGGLPEDRVIVSWFGVSSLAVSFDGRVALLDTYINSDQPASCGPGGSPPLDPSATGYTPVNYDQLAALKPGAIFVGHGHFDHECMTGPIAAETGAKIVALPQDCALAREQVAGAGTTGSLRCPATLAATSAFGDSAKIKPLGQRVRVQVIRNVHSGPAGVPAPNSGGAESLMFRFRLGKFSLVWNDTAGPLRESAPDLLAELRRLPAADVEMGATLGLGIAEQGMRDAADYAEALRVKAFYPLHQDLIKNAALSASFGEQAATEFTSRGLGSTFHPLVDPDSYLKPIVFKTTAKRWR
jgi:L-ascorbate metabolism protein UlaG (beta-lactamase superfamily)